VQNQRPRVALAACAVMVICSAAMLFMGEYRVAAMIAAQAGLAFCLADSAAKSAGRSERNRPADDCRQTTL
jgi:hypothetical protein